MAGALDPASGPAVDQAARAAQAVTDSDITVRSEDDVVEQMRRRIADLEEKAETDRAAAEDARSQAAVERRAREAAEARARSATTEAERTKSASEASVQDSQLTAIDNSIAAHTEQMKSLKSQYAAAFAEGNADKLADLQEQIGRLSAEQVALENGKADLEARKAGRAVGGDTPPTRREGAPADPASGREAYIAGQTPIIQNWLRSAEGDRFFTDQAWANRVGAAANYAQQVKGLDPNTQAYVDFVREEIGLKQRQQPDAAPTNINGAGNPVSRGRDPSERVVTAPAGGATQGTPRPGSTDVYLTQAEREQARRDGVSEADYAKAKRDLIAEGLIGPNARSR